MVRSEYTAQHLAATNTEELFMSGHAKLANTLALPIALLASLFFSTRMIRAQAGSSSAPPASQRGDAGKIRLNEMRQREISLRNVTAAGVSAGDDRRIEARVEQIKHDYKQIQVLRNELVRSISAPDQPLNLQLISDGTREIKKRASRLQGNLALRLPVGEEKSLTSDDHMSNKKVREVLVTLCQRILEFTTNPIFENLGTVNVEQATKAKRDIESVIELSNAIRKSAERLKTSSASK